MARAPKISVVVPVYDEHENIGTCLRGLWQALSDTPHEILVCYDYDADTTLPAIEAMADKPPSLRLVKNTIGRGAANALRTGFAAASGDVVVTTMADLSDPPENVLRMADLMRREGLAVVAGSRYMRGGSQSGGPLLKRTLSRLGGVSLRWITGIGTRDATSNFRAYSKSFLEAVQVESRGGFEIALELTVKAHLMGLGVGEVPTTWTDRTAGKSRFRLWKWLPHYLGWWLRAAWQPIVVWAVLAFLVALAGWHPPGDPAHAAALRFALCLYAVPAAGAVLLARRLRGRTTAIDALHPLAWLHPGQLALLVGGQAWIGIALSGLACALVLGLSLGWSRVGRVCADLARRGLRLETLGLALLCLLLWIERLTFPTHVSVGDLDGSWMQAVAHIFGSGMLVGINWLFTAGPLGCFHGAAYDRDTFWTAAIVWECGIKLGVAILLTVSMLRLRSVIERVLYYALIFVMPIGHDSYAFLGILAATIWILDRPTLDRPVVTLGIVLLCAFGLAKFTLLVCTLACVALIVLSAWRTVSRENALAFLAAWGAVLVALWFLAGQSLRNVWPFITGSLESATGYNEAMSIPADSRALTTACVVGAATLIVACSYALARPRSAARLAGAAALLVTCFVAFRAGFTRGDSHVRGFFACAVVLPFVLGDPAGAGFVTRAGLRFGRLVCAAAAVYGLIAPGGLDANAGRQLVSDAVHLEARNLKLLLDLPGLHLANETRREHLKRDYDLPRVRAAVGNATIDTISWQQGLLLLHDMRWKPRLTIQSYCAYTPNLLEKNADCLRGEEAPEFVLFNLESVDGRFPTMDDSLVLQVLARDYRALFMEHGYLLMHHEPRADPPPPREALLDRTVRFDERIELPGSGGQCQVIALDIRYSILGRLRTMLYGAPPLYLEVGTRNGPQCAPRIVPGMVSSGIILNPLILDQRQWAQWMLGEPLPRVTSVRIPPSQAPWMYEPEIRLRLLSAADLQPRCGPDLKVPSFLPAMVPEPVTVESDRPVRTLTMQAHLVMVLHAPSRVSLLVQAGHHRLSGEYGFALAARNPDCNAVARVSVLLEEGGVETKLLERTLDKQRLEDQDGIPFEVTIEARGPATVWLVTHSAGGDADCTWTYWRRVRLDQ